MERNDFRDGIVEAVVIEGDAAETQELRPPRIRRKKVYRYRGRKVVDWSYHERCSICDAPGTIVRKRVCWRWDPIASGIPADMVPWHQFKNEKTILPKNLFARKETDDPICSACEWEIGKAYTLIAKGCSWLKKHRNDDERREINTLRQQCKRGKITKAERDKAIEAVHSASRARYYRETFYAQKLYQLHLADEDGACGWLDFLEQHRRKTNQPAYEDDLHPGIDLPSDFEPSHDGELDLVELMARGISDVVIDQESDDSEKTYRDRRHEEAYGHDYSQGYSAYSLENPPRHKEYDVNHYMLTNQSYVETILGKDRDGEQTRTTTGRQAKVEWEKGRQGRKPYNAVFPGWRSNK